MVNCRVNNALVLTVHKYSAAKTTRYFPQGRQHSLLLARRSCFKIRVLFIIRNTSQTNICITQFQVSCISQSVTQSLASIVINIVQEQDPAFGSHLH